MESQHLENRKRSKKVKKKFNLLDFVVIKKKNVKITKKVTKKINLVKRRGKLKKKKLSTLKKKIIRFRNDKNIKTEDNQAVEVTEIVDAIVGNHEKTEEGLTSKNAEDLNEINNKLNSIELVDVEDNHELNSIKHSRTFRDYCDHFIAPKMRDLSIDILESLFKFQENKHHQNPVKAKAHKRYVVGFNEVKKNVIAGRLKLILIAPDLEKNSEVDKIVNELKISANEKSIPYIFSIKRRKIGFILLKKVPVSCVGIFDFQGVQDKVVELLQLVDEEKTNYKNKKSP